MFKLFKKSANNEVVVAEPKAKLKGKTINEIIDEIHENFYTEVDRLLASAKISNSLDTDKQDLIDKRKRLVALGFSGSKEVAEADVEIARLAALEQENKKKEHVIAAINHFSFKYPNYKFITEESVKKICAKYSLVYGEASKYIGTIPDKNLKHIEDFKIDTEDECSEAGIISFRRFSGDTIKSGVTFRSSKERLVYEQSIKDTYTFPSMYYREYFDACPLEIAAPLKDFNMTDHEVKDFKISKIEIPDPVVLKPVFFGGQKHYLIVTAWGQEASDELVVNQKMN